MDDTAKTGVFIFAGWFALLYLLAGAATACVGGLAHAGFSELQHRSTTEQRPEDTVMVIVAARALEPGAVIAGTDLYAVEIQPRYLPEGVFLSPESVIGRTPDEWILANELIRTERLRP